MASLCILAEQGHCQNTFLQKSGVSAASDAVGPLDFLDFSRLPSPSACPDWLKLRRSVFSRAGRVVPVWIQLKKSCWWCMWTNADGRQTRLNACQGKTLQKSLSSISDQLFTYVVKWEWITSDESFANGRHQFGLFKCFYNKIRVSYKSMILVWALSAEAF